MIAHVCCLLFLLLYDHALFNERRGFSGSIKRKGTWNAKIRRLIIQFRKSLVISHYVCLLKERHSLPHTWDYLLIPRIIIISDLLYLF
ncbi:uncharacterized protein EV154DRAFT_495612 [Mucor mucedo]|uniref:uncharacterized protein n=1 Tax=Mucor mucedo TaxID=29922 RepID=UPI00221F6E53|nr:uncharacterized protein EV154DRAFT_495612 [Mucor mucedo]KAI7895316.1 hypothetical protein EV154DRAFT_495612 [Mucor mucedo]